MYFKNEYDFLSNMYDKYYVLYDGIQYSCAETAFQAQKCIDNSEKYEFICLNGYEAKKLDRKVKLRPDWNAYRLEVMKKVIDSKFSNMILAEKLIDTGDVEIVEDNYWNDTFWGRCNGVGENHLGVILMEKRDELKSFID